jgi:hypothetical protein
MPVQPKNTKIKQKPKDTGINSTLPPTGDSAGVTLHSVSRNALRSRVTVWRTPTPLFLKASKVFEWQVLGVEASPW